MLFRSYWMNKHFAIPEDKRLTKHDDVVIRTKAEIDAAYADGRTTLMGDEELFSIIKRLSPEFVEEFGGLI